MKLLTLAAHNFGSHEDLVLDFKGGLTLIDGWNHDLDSANGVGKSIMLNAIIFALYGETVKKLNLQELIRSGQTNMSTAITLVTKTGEISIFRSRGPNHVKLSINGEMFDGTSAKVESRIAEVLDLNYKQFVQVCYRYQKARDRFIELNDTAKKDFLTSILSLDRYSVAYKNTHAKLTDLEKKLAYVDGKIVSETRSLELTSAAAKKATADVRIYTAEWESMKQVREEKLEKFERQWNEEWVKIQTTYSEYQGQATIKTMAIAERRNKALGALLTEQSARDKSVKESAALVGEWKAKAQASSEKLKKAQQVMYSAEDYGRQLTRLKSEQQALWQAREWRVEDNCSKCGQKMPEADPGPENRHYQEYDAKIKANNAQQAELVTKRDKASKITQAICDGIEAEYKHAAAEAQRIESEGTQRFDLKISEWNRELAAIDADQRALNARDTEAREVVRQGELNIRQVRAQLQADLDSNVRQAANSLSIVTQTAHTAEAQSKTSAEFLQKLEAERAELATDQLYLAEAKKLFSPTGVRAFIFDGIVTSLNQRIDYYLQVFFNGAMKFEYVSDEETGKFTESLVYGMKYTVGMLSGGEESRLSMAIDLALSDVIASRLAVQPNVLILDEAADGMDAIGREQLMTLLQELEKTRDVIFVVDHHSEFKTNFSNVIRLELRNEVTSRT